MIKKHEIKETLKSVIDKARFDRFGLEIEFLSKNSEDMIESCKDLFGTEDNEVYTKGDFCEWTIGRDSSLVVMDEEHWGCDIESMEISTPTIRKSNFDREFDKLIKFGEILEKSYVFINRSCSCHVHLSCSDMVALKSDVIGTLLYQRLRTTPTGERIDIIEESKYGCQRVDYFINMILLPLLMTTEQSYDMRVYSERVKGNQYVKFAESLKDWYNNKTNHYTCNRVCSINKMHIENRVSPSMITSETLSRHALWAVTSFNTRYNTIIKLFNDKKIVDYLVKRIKQPLNSNHSILTAYAKNYDESMLSCLDLFLFTCLQNLGSVFNKSINKRLAENQKEIYGRAGFLQDYTNRVSLLNDVKSIDLLNIA